MVNNVITLINKHKYHNKKRFVVPTQLASKHDN